MVGLLLFSLSIPKRIILIDWLRKDGVKASYFLEHCNRGKRSFKVWPIFDMKSRAWSRKVIKRETNPLNISVFYLFFMVKWSFARVQWIYRKIKFFIILASLFDTCNHYSYTNNNIKSVINIYIFIKYSGALGRSREKGSIFWFLVCRASSNILANLTNHSVLLDY